MADRTSDGIRFASRLERQRYDELKLLERAGKVKGLQCQVPYEFTETVSACKPVVSISRKRTYVADFVYYDVDMGRIIVEDVKGVLTKEYREKKRWMKAIYGIKIHEWPERVKKARKRK